MEFDSYCKNIGIDHYYGKEDYPDQSHYDGHWGIFDHYFLDFFADKIDEMKEPFFTSVFTLSSHQPYSIPKKFQGQFAKGDLAIHESIGYADHSLELFFKRIKGRPWFNNTLFVITGDHTQKLRTKKYNNGLGRYRVPIIFYDPNQNLGPKSGKLVTQHVDIMPTVLDLLRFKPENRLLFGTSVFNKDKGRLINLTSRTFIYLDYPYLIYYLNGVKKVENIETGGPTDWPKILLDELKAYLQYTRNGLLLNDIYSE